MLKNVTTLLLLALSTHLPAADLHELRIVKQIYNINAEEADKVYQFVPDYMAINVGDRVKFLGTVGRHTVHSVRQMMPEGTEKIAIMPRQNNEVTFNKPGIYGIQCKLHQRHGMVSLIVVGGDLHNMQQAREGASKWVSSHTRAKMHKLLDKAGAAFGEGDK